MPYGTVNLRNGVPVDETSITCTAGVGTFILEFGTLSRLTGDPLFEEVRGSGNMVGLSVWLVIAEDRNWCCMYNTVTLYHCHQIL
jgi:hypothetical protein